MNKYNIQYLSLYSLFLKVMSFISVGCGLVAMGGAIYLWGRIKTFYDMIQATINNFAILAELGLSDASPSLPDLSLWPISLVLLTILVLTIIIPLTLWASSARLDILQIEIKQYAITNNKINRMSHEIQVVTNYFRELSQKQKPQ